ncbi:uncharacterized protein [Hoplias malabaricus]|uniref:uncharacterized protein n=1 Tax=Hoplias malabaricus TaxID=27720 RepID=UPI0034637827
MAPFTSFLWLMLVGVIVSTLTIVLIFIIINVCISKNVERRRANISKANQANSEPKESGLFSANISEEKPPPLPSRDQFLIEESRSNSYEEVDADACVEPVNVEVQQALPPLQSTFIKFPETNNNWDDVKSVADSYDDVEQFDHSAPQSYEDVASLPDYVELEEEPPPLQEQAEFHSQSEESLASYDDIGAIDNVSEDYDDVG